MSEPNYREEMKLPEGRDCSECFAARHCIALGITTADRTTCDFWPNRFKLPVTIRTTTPESGKR